MSVTFVKMSWANPRSFCRMRESDPLQVDGGYPSQPSPACQIFHLRSLVCFHFRNAKKFHIFIDSGSSFVVWTHKTVFNAATRTFLRHCDGRFDDCNVNDSTVLAYFQFFDLTVMSSRKEVWDCLTSHARSL